MDVPVECVGCVDDAIALCQDPEDPVRVSARARRSAEIELRLEKAFRENQFPAERHVRARPDGPGPRRRDGGKIEHLSAETFAEASIELEELLSFGLELE